MSAYPRKKLEETVETNFKDEVAFLTDLVRRPSDNPPGDCAPHARETANRLAEMNFEVERHAMDEETCRANGMISAINLIVRHRFGDGPTIALNAHGDVVGPGEGWTADPYGAEIRDGWMYGRGAAVSKSDIVTYAYALRALIALEKSGVTLNGTIELHVTYDEEVGGVIGPKWLLERGISKPDLAIAAGFSYGVVTAHNGCLHLQITVRGKSAHAAQPHTGHDAMEAATDVLTTLYGHRRELANLHSAVEGIDTPSLTVGLVQGGINTNVVPDRVTLRIDRRLIPEENPEETESGLRRLAEQAVRGREGISVEITRIMLANPLRPLNGVERLTDPLTKHASEVFGTEVRCHGVPLYTDARHYAAAGVPIALYGPGPRTITEANAHRADERVALDDLRRATLVVALTLADVLSNRRPKCATRF